MTTWRQKSSGDRGQLHYLWHLARRNPLFVTGVAVVAALVIAALFAPYITPYPQDALHGINFAEKLKPPSLQHLFGADALGRDIFTRVVFGARMSLKIGLTVILLSLAIGVPLGLIAGFFGGKIDEIIMRLTDMFLALYVSGISPYFAAIGDRSSPGSFHHQCHDCDRHLLVSLVCAPDTCPGLNRQRGTLC
jgi:ABC-type dipeptide/oligopeptide/nickel transport system permease subunit